MNVVIGGTGGTMTMTLRRCSAAVVVVVVVWRKSLQ